MPVTTDADARRRPGRRGKRVLRAYRGAACLARATPAWAVSGVAALAGTVAAAGLGRRRRLVRRHLRRVLGPGTRGPALEWAVVRSFASYARYWLETFRLPTRPVEDLCSRVDVEGAEHLDAAVAAGHGVVVASAHLGAWDVGGAWLAARGLRPLTVAEALRPPELFDWFVGLRRAVGVEVIGRGPGAWAALQRAVEEGRAVALVSDRDLGRRGVGTEFFGEATTLPAGPAVLALRSGAPLIPAACYYRPGGRYVAVFRPALRPPDTGDGRRDVVRFTQDLARELEALIRRSPEQWHVMQPNWPSDLRIP